MSRTTNRLAAVALGALVSVAGATAAAQADTGTITDPKPNITKVKVSHGSTSIKVTTTTGAVTNPRMTGSTVPLPPDPVDSLRPELTGITAELRTLQTQNRRLADRVHAQDARLARINRAVDRRSLPERAYRKVQRALTRIGP